MNFQIVLVPEAATEVNNKGHHEWWQFKIASPSQTVQEQMVANYISANTDNEFIIEQKITLKFGTWQKAEWVFFTLKDLKADKRVGNGMVRAAFLQ